MLQINDDIQFCIDFLTPYYHNNLKCDNIKDDFITYQLIHKGAQIYNLDLLIYSFNYAVYNHIFSTNHFELDRLLNDNGYSFVNKFYLFGISVLVIAGLLTLI